MQSRNWNSAKDQIVDASVAPLTACANPTDRPERLFHFTDSAGLVGILQSRSLRASLATSLNDPSEIAHGMQCSREVLARGVVSISREFLDTTSRLLDPANVRQAYRLEWRAYVISFCASVDNVLHWLHYGRSGTGVAIGFDATAVRRAPFDLFKVVYDRAEQDRLVASVIQGTAGALEHCLVDLEAAEGDALKEVAAHIAAGRLWALASLMKNPVFAAEGEWRLVTHDLRGERIPNEHMVPLRMDYRATSGRVVPFQELVFDHLPATEIVLGWSAAMEPNDQGLDELMHNTCGTLTVRRSTVPVRP